MIIIIILYAKTVENIGKILGIRGMGKSPSNDVPKMKESLDGPIEFCGRTEEGMDGFCHQRMNRTGSVRFLSWTNFLRTNLIVSGIRRDDEVDGPPNWWIKRDNGVSNHLLFYFFSLYLPII